MSFKIYTKTGDKGKTSLFGGAKLFKSHIRIEAYGTVDELNDLIGLVRDSITHELLRTELEIIQNKLFTLGSILACDPSKKMNVPQLQVEDVELLERGIDRMDAVLPALKNFILPGGHPVVSQCHIARCVCRRAERRTVALQTESPLDDLIIKYLNRLSDYLFMVARRISQEFDVAEVIWKS